MISPQIMVQDIDAGHWLNLIGLFSGKPESDFSLLLLIVEGDRCLKAIHSRKGVLWRLAYAGRDSLPTLAEELEVDSILVLPRGGLQEVFYHVQSAVDYADTYDKQIFDMLAAGNEALDRIALWYPQKPFAWKPPDYAKVQKRFGRLWPNDTTIGFFVMDQGKAHTSLILGKTMDRLTLMTTLDAFAGDDLPLDFRRNAKALTKMIAQRFAPVYSAFFIELSSLAEMRVGTKPLSYLKLAEKRGRAKVYPKPLKLRLILAMARLFKRM